MTGTTDSAHSKPIGLIGLGLMGHAMAQRLVQQGYQVLGADIAAAAKQALVALGPQARVADTADVIASVDCLILSLPTHHDVNAVLTEQKSRLRADQVILDTTTGDPENARTIAAELASRGVHYLDATISGSSRQLSLGDVTWMVGGHPDGVAVCSSILADLGKRTFHLGAAGTGGQMKLVTNLVLGLNRAALAEGLAFAESMKLDLNQTLDVLQASMAYSRIMDTKGSKMIDGDYTTEARLSQHRKDVQLMLNAAADTDLSLPLSATHLSLLDDAIRLGWGDADNSAVMEVFRRDTGSE